MVARSPKKIRKAHELNKRVKLEKKRLRKRGPKKHEQKPTIKPASRVHIKLDAEAKEALYEYCFRNNVKPYKAVKQILKLMIERDAAMIKEKVSKDLAEGLIDELKAKAVLNGI